MITDDTKGKLMNAYERLMKCRCTPPRALEESVELLKLGINEGEWRQQCSGLCLNCDIDELDYIDECMFGSWDKYSGCDVYPVPSPVLGRCEDDAYNQVSVGVSMYEGEYGALRIELAKHCLECLEYIISVVESKDV